MNHNSSFTGCDNYSVGYNEDTTDFNSGIFRISDLAVIYKTICDSVEKMEGAALETYIRKSPRGIKVSLYLEGKVLHQTLFRSGIYSNLGRDAAFFRQECIQIHKKVKERRYSSAKYNVAVWSRGLLDNTENR